MAARDKQLSLQPSASKRWLACTASPLYIVANADRIPEERDSVWSREGTAAHDVAANALVLGAFDPEGVPEGFLEPVEYYVRTVLGHQRPQSVLAVEEKVPLWYARERRGQIDARTFDLDEDGAVCRLRVDDYKHGAGVKVDAEGNTQLLIYARSVIEELLGVLTVPRSTPVTLAIHQPRARNADGTASSEWALTVGEVFDLSDPIETTANAIQAAHCGDQVALAQLKFCVDDEVCQFCPMKKVGCIARQAVLPVSVHQALGLPLVADDPVARLKAATLTPEQVALIVRHRKAIVKFLDDVADGALQILEQDANALPGLKLVASKGGHRKWTDEAEALRILATKFGKSEVTETSVISPAKAEKLIVELETNAGGKPATRLRNLLDDITTKGGGAPIIVPVDDPRPSLTLADSFESASETESQ